MLLAYGGLLLPDNVSVSFERVEKHHHHIIHFVHHLVLAIHDCRGGTTARVKHRGDHFKSLKIPELHLKPEIYVGCGEFVSETTDYLVEIETKGGRVCEAE